MSRGADATLIIVLVGVLSVAVALLVILRVGRSRRTPAFKAGDPGAVPPRAAVIVNPTKIAEPENHRTWVTSGCTAAGWAPPIWFDTTPDDPGVGQARKALDDGATTVIACGGDGTVRAVASALAGTGVPLALLPAGTGNLLARNLSVPFTDPEACLRVALGGRDKPVDVGIAEVDVSGEDESPARNTFLVMAGLGFDAETMASVEPRLKKRVGWWAYVVAGAQNLRGRRTRVVIRLDGGPPLSRRVRSVIVGNCGELTGGVRLMPDARVDDGWLDVVIVAPRGVGGWAAVAAAVLTRARRTNIMVQHLRCRRIEIRAERPLHIQLDGDPVGTGRALRASVDPSSLLVRVQPD